MEALKSKRLNKIVLAEKIAKRFCPTYASAWGGDSLTGSSDSSSSGDYVTPPSSLEEANFTPTQLLCQLPVLNSGEDDLHSTVEIVSGYEEEFVSLVDSTRDHLERKKRSKIDFYHFKVSLTKIPVLTKKKRLYFHEKKSREILRADSMEEVFEILHPFWNYADYMLLDYIVENNCDEGIRRHMRSYKQRLHNFEKETTLHSFRLAAPAIPKILPKRYSSLTATLGIGATECTLWDVRQKIENIAKRANLQPYVTYLQHIKTGRTQISLFIAFPRSVYRDLKRSLDREFLQEIGISPQSLIFQKKPSPFRPRENFVAQIRLEYGYYSQYSTQHFSNRGNSMQGSAANTSQPRIPCSLPASMGQYSSYHGSLQSILHEHASLVQEHAVLVREHAILLHKHLNPTPL